MEEILFETGRGSLTKTHWGYDSLTGIFRIRGANNNIKGNLQGRTRLEMMEN